MNNELYHYGVLGMRWGIRKSYDRNGTFNKTSDTRYDAANNAEIKINKDGSKTIPKGFFFNRVGKASLDVNKSGGLYVSYGKEDAARYIKSLGPTPIAKLLGVGGEAVQHIKVKQSLKMPSDEQTAMETAKLLLNNPKLHESFNKSLYSISVTGDFDKSITREDIEKALKKPNGKECQKLSYGVSSFLGDPNYVIESKQVYDHFRKRGYDAIPDVHDRLSGTSKTGLIIINPAKIEVSSTTTITKDVMKSAKQYVKTIEKLKINELIK